MGDASIAPRFGNMRALLGIVAGAGASYGLYKLLSGESFKRNKKSAASEGAGPRTSPPGEVPLQPGSLLARVSGLDVACPRPVDAASGEIIHQSPGNLEPQHLKMLLSCLQTSNNPLDRCRILLTLGNSAAFTVNQAPASVVLLFDSRTAPAVLLRLLMFAGNLKAWRPSAQVANELRRKQDCLYRVMLDESSQLHSRLVQLLSHPDVEIQSQVSRILT
ncbi:hypothetical protein EYF80_018864 [Liparis tanakae]|uniref:Armadillo repeat-containing domain-containing protein n=1 Tax=Liparis tanakae TaxID=230148 RepID=A0A4Z2HYF1_9TELE|nr:hypothetical protein EYF80_018864 [Liparis tanakae]